MFILTICFKRRQVTVLVPKYNLKKQIWLPEFQTITSSSFYSLSDDLAERGKRLEVRSSEIQATNLDHMFRIQLMPRRILDL